MAQIISVHSFRRSTGKSTITVNLAALLAASGQRVGLVDADILSPSLHWLLGLGKADIGYCLNDYLLDRHNIIDAAHDVTDRLTPNTQGSLFLIPASEDALQIARVLHERYNTELLNEGCQRLISELKLDALLIDTHAGLDEDSLASIAMSDKLIIMLRPDKQDYQGTAVTVDVARRLEVPDLSIIVNMVPLNFDLAEVATEAQHTYNCTVSAVLPVSEEIMAQSGATLFVQDHPHHPITTLLNHVATWLAPN